MRKASWFVYASFLAGIALVALVAYTYWSTSFVAESDSPPNAFIRKANAVLAPVAGADAIPFIPRGLTVSVGQGVVKRDYSEFEYSLFKQVEKRAVRAGDEIYYKIVVNSKPEEYLKWFTESDLLGYGYASNGVFKTRRFSSADEPACKFERISLSDAVEFCVWRECSAPVCSHSFADCGEARVDFLIEGSEEQRANVYSLEEEFKKAFADVC